MARVEPVVGGGIVVPRGEVVVVVVPRGNVVVVVPRGEVVVVVGRRDDVVVVRRGEFPPGALGDDDEGCAARVVDVVEVLRAGGAPVGAGLGCTSR